MRTVNKLKLLLLADSETERLDITEMLKNIDYIHLSGDTVDETKTWESLERSQVDILLMGSGLKGERYAFAEKVSHQFPHTGIIMVEDRALGRDDA